MVSTKKKKIFFLPATRYIQFMLKTLYRTVEKKNLIGT
jgi:hypothetical protein